MIRRCFFYYIHGYYWESEEVHLTKQLNKTQNYWSTLQPDISAIAITRRWGEPNSKSWKAGLELLIAV